MGFLGPTGAADRCEWPGTLGLNRKKKGKGKMTKFIIVFEASFRGRIVNQSALGTVGSCTE